MDPQLGKAGVQGSESTATVIVQFKSTESIQSAGLSRAQIQREKMRIADESQREFVKELSSFSPAIAQERFSLWVNNSMILEADQALIEFLSKREDVERVVLDEEILLEEPINVQEVTKSNSSLLTYGLEKVRAKEVWEEFGITGSGVRVGILDTGFAEHPDLTGRVDHVRDFAGSKPDGQPNDGHGHGTHCMGTIGGKNTSGKAIGVAPDVRYVVAKIFSDSGRTTDAKIMKAMQWITDPDGNPETEDQPRVVSNSWGGPKKGYEASKPRWDVVSTWRELGMVPVFAAGNSGSGKSTVGSPGAFPHSFTIGATDNGDKIARFSSRGPVTWKGESHIKPNVSAPGVDVYSASHKDGGYRKMSGTSMATPHVAGVIALLLQANPDASVEDIERVLQETAVDLGSEGLDNDYGHGRVDAYEAVKKFAKIGTLELTIKSDYPATISIESLGLQATDSEEAPTILSLLEGTYDVTISAFGHLSRTVEVTITARETTSLAIDLEPLARHTLTVGVKNTDGEPLEATVAFPGTPILASQATSGIFVSNLPKGSYTAIISLKGYRSERRSFELEANHPLNVVMEQAPSTLLVQGDQNSSFQDYYEQVLVRQFMEFDVLGRTGQMSIYDLIAYDRVIWYTGNLTQGVLSEDEQTALAEYVEKGGSLILSGKGIGNDLGKTSFYGSVLGASFKGDRKWWKTVTGSGMKFSLNDDGSAENQDTPDALDATDSNATILFSYRFGSDAGLARSHGAGKVVYLGFGLEGIGVLETRSAVFKKLVESSKPTLRAKLTRLGAAFELDRGLHKVLSSRFKVNRKDLAAFQEFLKTTDSKVPYQTQIFQAQNLYR
jgi:subtilisin family serine protease